MQKKIFIAGCGRSGTTLALRLMRCFSGHVVLKERPWTHFAEVETDKNAIFIKRDARTWKNLHEMPDDIGLIYMVRHPYDVLTSYHRSQTDRSRYYITPERWLNEFAAYERMKDHDKFVLRYEDVVAEPDAVQEQLAEKFGLRIRERFSEREKISASSLYRWRGDDAARTYVEGLDIRDALETFMEEFGYASSPPSTSVSHSQMA